METGLRVLLNESCRKSEYLGGFGFCPSRPTNKFCRTRMRTNSSIGYAIVFDDKIDRIGKFFGVARQEYLQIRRCPEDGPYQTLKPKAFFDLPKERALAYSRGKAPGMESDQHLVLD